MQEQTSQDDHKRNSSLDHLQHLVTPNGNLQSILHVIITFQLLQYKYNCSVHASYPYLNERSHSCQPANNDGYFLALSSILIA